MVGKARQFLTMFNGNSDLTQTVRQPCDELVE
jgi:hypothetical protein